MLSLNQVIRQGFTRSSGRMSRSGLSKNEFEISLQSSYNPRDTAYLDLCRCPRNICHSCSSRFHFTVYFDCLSLCILEPRIVIQSLENGRAICSIGSHSLPAWWSGRRPFPADVRSYPHDHYSNSFDHHVRSATVLQKKNRAKIWMGWCVNGMWAFDIAWACNLWIFM